MRNVASLAGIAAKAALYLQSNLSVRKAPLAYVGGWLGKNNLGDQALFHATRNLFPDYSLWHFDGSRTLSALLDAVPRTSAGLFAGGTFINRAPELLDLARQFRRTGRKLFFFGAGVADPEFWIGRGDFEDMLPAWKNLLNECGTIGVRGPRSAQLLADAGVARVNVVGDPVLAFADDSTSPAVHKRSLGLNFGFDHGHQWGEPAHVREQMYRLATLAISNGWRVKWFVVFPKDLELTRELAQATGTEIFYTYDNAQRYIREVSSMSLFVGMKLHATMLALCGYVPSLMLEYDPKCADFMYSIDQGSAMMRTDRFNADAAWELLLHWHTERASRSHAIRSSIQKLRLHQLHCAQLLAQDIASRN